METLTWQQNDVSGCLEIFTEMLMFAIISLCSF